MPTRMSTAILMNLGVIVGIPLLAGPLHADEEKSLRPEIQNMVQSVSERIQAVADKLDLTAEQRTKIREIQASRAEKHKALRAERQALLQEELKALGTILTPEQRDKVKELIEDRVEQVSDAGKAGLPMFAAVRDTLADRVETAGERIGVTAEQREQIIKALSSYADRHAALKAK